MKIDVSFEIGDPVIEIKYNQHDGYYMEYHAFCYRDLEHLDMIFTDYKQAKMKLDQLESKGRNK